MRVLGRNQMTNTVVAIARASGSSSSSSGGPLFNGAGLVSTKAGNYNYCLLLNGSANLQIYGAGLYINCSRSCSSSNCPGSKALFMNGNSTLYMDGDAQIVGCWASNGSVNVNQNKLHCGANGGVSQTIDATTFASIPTSEPPPPCGGNAPAPQYNASAGGYIYSPGIYNSITINSGQTAIFNPGVYCINGSFNLNGSATLKGPNGKVQFVLQNQYIILNGGGKIDFNDLEIYGNNASFTLNGGALFNANRLRMYSTGSGNFTVNGLATLTSQNAYFYLKNGDLIWNGNSNLNLKAPPQGDPYGGLLVYMPWNTTNNNDVNFNGGSNIKLRGTFLAPRRRIVFNGGVNFEIHSQIIGYEYIVNGGGDVKIYFNANENYNPPNTSAPSIQLTK
jgi:hypothetical protein